MSLVLKATTIAFQYNNQLNLTDEDFKKQSKHDDEMGSPNELRNNMCMKCPNLFEQFNFSLGFISNSTGFMCNYTHFQNFMNGSQWDHKNWMTNLGQKQNDNKFLEVISQWKTQRNKIILIKFFNFIVFFLLNQQICSIQNSNMQIESLPILEKLLFVFIQGTRIVIQYSTAFSLFSLLWFVSGQAFKYDEDYKLRTFEFIGVQTQEMFFNKQFRNKLTKQWNTSVAQNMQFQLYIQLMIAGVERNIAFYLNGLISGIWHGVGIGWFALFFAGSMHSKASTIMYKSDSIKPQHQIIDFLMVFLSFTCMVFTVSNIQNRDYKRFLLFQSTTQQIPIIIPVIHSELAKQFQKKNLKVKNN